MNSEVTLVNCSTSPIREDQVRLLFKRNDTHHAVLVEDDVPRYFLTTSNRLSKVRIHDASQQMVASISEQRMFFKDVFIFGKRNAGKAVKVTDVLQRGPATTTDGQLSVALHTEEGVYHWRKKSIHHWELYEDSSLTSVAWTETVVESAPSWALVIERRALNVLDYVLASLFYLKASSNTSQSGGGLKAVNHGVAGAAYLSVK